MNKYAEMVRVLNQSQDELDEATREYRTKIAKHQQLEQNIIEGLVNARDFFFLRLDKRRLQMAGREPKERIDRMGQHMGRNR